MAKAKINLQDIKIVGAREHNLKNISVTIPRNSFTVITGVSGSGKSSLAFDTLYAEGQRRYVESLSSYARQFLGLMKKPDVDYIEGLSPAISIEQKKLNRNPRSTVGTITEIYDYLRLLYANAAEVFCYKCGRKLEKQSIDQIVNSVLSYPQGTKVMILSPYAVNKKGTFKNDFENLRKIGFYRAIVDGKEYTFDQNIELNKNEKHDIYIIVDRIQISSDRKKRIFESIEQAIKYGNDKVLIRILEENNTNDVLYSTKLACPHCDISYPDITPALFSFNAPEGACPSCHGLGVNLEFDVEKILDTSLSIEEGAIIPFTYDESSWFGSIINSACKSFGIPLDIPLENIEKDKLNILLYGSQKEITISYKSEKSQYIGKKLFEGIIPLLKRRYDETNSEDVRQWLEQYMKENICTKCNGNRLNEYALSIKIEGINIIEFSKICVEKSLEFIKNLKLSETKQIIVKDILKEITSRLKFLQDVGLGYITLDRKSYTLSGGEAQRIHLATQIGSQLSGVMYVLDEPTIGLHQKDNEKLINALKELQSIGNTLIIVEHDKQTMLESDYIIDLGPSAGLNGGNVMFEGPIEDLLKTNTLTALYLNGTKSIKLPEKRRKGNGKFITIKKASLHNLKNIDVKIPLETFTVVTGVSGSGKSSLIIDLIYPALLYEKSFKKKNSELSKYYHSIEGSQYINSVYHIDQSPIGRTPRSNPATYSKVFDHIRALYASLPESKARGYNQGRFSFNVKGGRCEHCQGEGETTIHMHFLPDISVICEVCKGKRFNSQTLEVLYKGKNISDILDLSVDEAYDFFSTIPSISNKLKLLIDVGLGYIKLGQSATTLSGGEAQRLKLTRELGKTSKNGISNIYFLDEPTTGLHFDDIQKLIMILQRLVDNGNTVVVIEHNLDLIKSADYVIDLGPEGGEQGGNIVFQGYMDDFISFDNSYTSYYLRKEIDNL
ncbi:MAG TPA: excinuclease ABC subunit UvrA [Exilispira sp.]|nr:excinuclease ABC subunit UvrA [Exilispira sp.]